MAHQFKSLQELTQIDEMHQLLAQITGTQISIELLHQAVSKIELHSGVPEAIRNQFNVARNMACYTYYFYALAPEVQHKTFSIIELALRTRIGSGSRMTLQPMLEKAVKSGWINDAGFRHINNPDPENPFCRSIVKALPQLRNSAAHGSTDLTPDCVWYLERCADLINQLFQVQHATSPTSSTAA